MEVGADGRAMSAGEWRRLVGRGALGGESGFVAKSGSARLSLVWLSYRVSRGHQGPTAPAYGGQHPVSTSACRKARSRKAFKAPSQRRQVAAHHNRPALAGFSSLVTLESVMAPPASDDAYLPRPIHALIAYQ